MLRAAIFDLDGTLLDTLDDLADSMNAALAALGLPVHPVHAYRTFVGEGVELLITRAMPTDVVADTALIQRATALYKEAYAQRWHAKTQPYHGILEMIAALQAARIPLAVLSNKPDHFTQLVMAHYFPAGTFSPIFGQRQHVPRKPDPAGALEIAQLWNLPPEKIAYVGDTATDMQTGRSAGMRTHGVAWGFRPVSELRENGAHLILTAPQEILPLFFGKNQ
jgi:phosphoglycolate phosphatase